MGMGHYERLLIHHLIRSSSPSEWRFDIRFGGRSPGQPLDPDQVEPGLNSAGFMGFSPLRLCRLPWGLTRTAMRAAAGRPAPNIYHSMALSCPAPSGRPSVYIIHDLPPARFTDEGVVPVWAKQAGKSAAAIYTPSQFAKDEIVELLGVPESRVHVIMYGCEHETFNTNVTPASCETLASLGINGPFLLYVGGFTRRKNVAALLDAWKRLAIRYPGLSLALVGPAPQLQSLANDSGAPCVVAAGYLDRTVLPSVMKASTALVFPSIYEGFGLPPLEAMALGVPVVAVRAGAIPEVVGDAAVLATDGTSESLEAAVISLLDDSSIAQKLMIAGPARAQTFSWEAHANHVQSLYRAVLAQ